MPLIWWDEPWDRPEPVLELLRRSLGILATGLGSGYAPFASGTIGTLPAVAIHWLLLLVLTPLQFTIFAIAFIPLAILAADIEARRHPESDPSVVVVDEWAGYFVTVAGHPVSWTTVALAFFIFRLLDIVKPFPARRLEGLHGGAGIVLDDVMVGIYGNLLVLLLGRWV